jgi:hypothetical protein
MLRAPGGQDSIDDHLRFEDDGGRPAHCIGGAGATQRVDELEGRTSGGDLLEQRRGVDHRLIVERDVTGVITP